MSVLIKQDKKLKKTMNKDHWTFLSKHLIKAGYVLRTYTYNHVVEICSICNNGTVVFQTKMQLVNMEILFNPVGN